MPFFPVDDDFAYHSKATAAGNAAIGLWTRAGAHCMKQATDGVIQRHELPGLGRPAEARRLVDVELWHTHGHDCDRCPQPPQGGWIFHDWEDIGRFKTSTAIKADREAARERMRRNRSRAQDGGSSSGVRANRARTPSTGSRSPSPSPSSVVTEVSPSPTATRGADGLTDEDLDKIRQRLGAASSTYARQVATEVLARAQVTVANPLRYVLAAIDQEPDRYRPTPGPPRAGDCCPIPGHGSYRADNCGACRSEHIATPGGTQ